MWGERVKKKKARSRIKSKGIFLSETQLISSQLSSVREKIIINRSLAEVRRMRWLGSLKRVRVKAKHNPLSFSMNDKSAGGMKVRQAFSSSTERERKASITYSILAFARWAELFVRPRIRLGVVLTLKEDIGEHFFVVQGSTASCRRQSPTWTRQREWKLKSDNYSLPALITSPINQAVRCFKHTHTQRGRHVSSFTTNKVEFKIVNVLRQ